MWLCVKTDCHTHRRIDPASDKGERTVSGGDQPHGGEKTRTKPRKNGREKRKGVQVDQCLGVFDPTQWQREAAAAAAAAGLAVENAAVQAGGVPEHEGVDACGAHERGGGHGGGGGGGGSGSGSAGQPIAHGAERSEVDEVGDETGRHGADGVAAEVERGEGASLAKGVGDESREACRPDPRSVRSDCKGLHASVRSDCKGLQASVSTEHAAPL